MRSILVALLMLTALGMPVFADPAATQIINDIRKDKRRKSISYSEKLAGVAAAHAAEMVRVGYFGHTGANGSSVGDRTTAQGYKWCFIAENIAQGQRSLEEVMAAWVSSKGHYKNMVHKNVREFGLARGANNTWVMVLSRPC